MTSACRLLEIWGSPRDRGIRYGEGASAEIHRGTSHYIRQMESLGLSQATLADLVEAYLPIIRDFDADHVEEMQGIAQGADLPLSHIVLMNARTELLKLAKEPILRAGLLAERAAEGCTTIIVQPERTPDGNLIHAHNWDWKSSCADSCIILRIRNDDGPDMLTFTEAGGLARFGFNSLGIAITGNYLECERDYRTLGVPLALIRRKVLQQDNPSLAFGAAYATPKSASNNLAISHAPTGIVHDLECAPDETFVVEPRDGLLVHSNHWLSPVALAKLRETGVPDSPCTYWRQQRAERLLAPHDKIGLDQVRDVLLDTAGTPLSICVPPRASTMTGQTATVASFLMRPALGEMRVAMMPHAGADYVRYTLASDAPALAERPTADA
ncbi:MAG: C45 family autoproteolytic acyltransferase/hydrolase [Sphingomonas sp.]|uniref:C45 family autoproteolytic acyltransferase/hydolase n=1 Tax=Sphingomonas sp. TaxID=28214 RepID=UPI003F810047